MRRARLYLDVVTELGERLRPPTPGATRSWGRNTVTVCQRGSIHVARGADLALRDIPAGVGDLGAVLHLEGGTFGPGGRLPDMDKPRARATVDIGPTAITAHRRRGAIGRARLMCRSAAVKAS